MSVYQSCGAERIEDGRVYHCNSPMGHTSSDHHYVEDTTIIPTFELAALREQLAELEARRVSRELEFAGDLGRAIVAREQAEAQLAAAMGLLNSMLPVGCWLCRRQIAFVDDDRSTMTHLNTHTGGNPVEDRCELSYLHGTPEVVRDFLADPANAEVVQQAQKAKLVQRRVEGLLLSPTTVFALYEVGLTDPKLFGERLRHYLLADEPEASSRKHEGQHYDSSLDCRCCDTCGKPLAECEGR